MNSRLLPFLFAVLAAAPLSAQTDITTEIWALLEADQPQDITANYASRVDSAPAKAIYYVAYAFLLQERYEEAVAYFDRALAKKPAYAPSHYYKGLAYQYTRRPAEALPCLLQAAEIEPTDGEYHSAVGDAFAALRRYDDAIAAYRRAVELFTGPAHAWINLARMYESKDDDMGALTVLYEAQARVDSTVKTYNTVLLNIGLLELEAGHPERAEPPLRELLRRNPDEFRAMSKLIQVCYARGDYAAARPWRDKLYAAHEKELLPEKMRKEFCFDQFDWQDRHILAYEQFDNEPASLYYKHVFYVLDATGKVERTIQTEYSRVSLAFGGKKYVMGMDRGNRHYTYIDTSFGDDPDYRELKKAVIDILERKLSPSSSSITNN
jgi:tetratricopeptide (TPR) repeat protein